MQNYKYLSIGLEDMANQADTDISEEFIIILGDGTHISLEDATIEQVAQAISIIRIQNRGEAPIKNP